MPMAAESFEYLIDRSQSLAHVLRYDPPPINPLQRARLVFQLRLAYNLTLNRCQDRKMSRRLLGLIEECEELLGS